MAAAPICSATSSNASPASRWTRSRAKPCSSRLELPISSGKIIRKNKKIAPAAGLRLRPRDAAKIGQLVLNRGAWTASRLSPAEWIEQSIKPRFQAIGDFSGLFFYGQQWWLGRSIARRDRK